MIFGDSPFDKNISGLLELGPGVIEHLEHMLLRLGTGLEEILHVFIGDCQEFDEGMFLVPQEIVEPVGGYPIEGGVFDKEEDSSAMGTLGCPEVLPADGDILLFDIIPVNAEADAGEIEKDHGHDISRMKMLVGGGDEKMGEKEQGGDQSGGNPPPPFPSSMAA